MHKHFSQAQATAEKVFFYLFKAPFLLSDGGLFVRSNVPVTRSCSGLLHCVKESCCKCLALQAFDKFLADISFYGPIYLF